MRERLGPFAADRAELEPIDLLRVAEDDDLGRVGAGRRGVHARGRRKRKTAEKSMHSNSRFDWGTNLHVERRPSKGVETLVGYGI
jgi:hypothetical protein